MINKPKKQLFSLPDLLPAFLIIPLILFFAYATYVEPRFFIVLGASLGGGVFFLGWTNFLILRRQTTAEFKKQEILEKNNLLEAEFTKESQTIDSLRQKVSDYLQLKGLVEKLCGAVTLADTSRTLSTEVNKVFGHQDHTVILYLFQSASGELGISASQKGQMEINIKAKKGDLCDQLVVKTMKPLLIEDTHNDFRIDADQVKGEEVRPVRSLMSVPMLVGDKAIGILRVDSPQPGHFTAEDIRLLTTVGDLGAMAIENAQLYERAQELAIHDSLTGLFLRRYFLDRLSYEIARELRLKSKLAFLMIDLDHFKQYNDRYGHMAGDIVLKTVAGLLAETFNQPGSMICRYGGEEFAVMLADCSKAKARDLAEKVSKLIAARDIVLRRENTRITVSIGVAVFPEDAQIREELIQKADLALYQAKNSGRNQVVVYGKPPGNGGENKR